jgi:hypothetical protein
MPIINDKAHTASKAGMPSNIPDNSAPRKLKPLDVIANEILEGKWGDGEDRKKRLETAGYTYDIVQKAVNRMTQADDLEEIAKKVIRGDFGNGDERKENLEKLGYDFDTIQAKVNELLK